MSGVAVATLRLYLIAIVLLASHLYWPVESPRSLEQILRWGLSGRGSNQRIFMLQVVDELKAWESLNSVVESDVKSRNITRMFFC